jgi:hypothetical protein
MSSLDNIPRKEKQFRNFTSNSLGLRGANEKIVGEIWNVLKAEREKRQALKQEQMEKAKEKKKQLEEFQKVETKEVSDDDDSDSDDEQKEEPKKEITTKGKSDIDPKQVKKVMKKALKKAPGNSMKIKELRKLIGNKLGVPKSEKKRLKDLLMKAPSIFKKDKIKVDGKIITLI